MERQDSARTSTFLLILHVVLVEAVAKKLTLTNQLTLIDPDLPSFYACRTFCWQSLLFSTRLEAPTARGEACVKCPRHKNEPQAVRIQCSSRRATSRTRRKLTRRPTDSHDDDISRRRKRFSNWVNWLETDENNFERFDLLSIQWPVSALQLLFQPVVFVPSFNAAYDECFDVPTYCTRSDLFAVFVPGFYAACDTCFDVPNHCTCCDACFDVPNHCTCSDDDGSEYRTRWAFFLKKKK
jgi:hypothetical protein